MVTRKWKMFSTMSSTTLLWYSIRNTTRTWTIPYSVMDLALTHVPMKIAKLAWIPLGIRSSRTPSWHVKGAWIHLHDCKLRYESYNFVLKISLECCGCTICWWIYIVEFIYINRVLAIKFYRRTNLKDFVYYYVQLGAWDLCFTSFLLSFYLI